jgi:hypothetical protein
MENIKQQTILWDRDFFFFHFLPHFAFIQLQPYLCSLKIRRDLYLFSYLLHRYSLKIQRKQAQKVIFSYITLLSRFNFTFPKILLRRKNRKIHVREEE